MTVGPIETYKIETKTEADEYLKFLFEKQEYRSMDEVLMRARNHIIDEDIKTYFIQKAKIFLKEQEN